MKLVPFHMFFVALTFYFISNILHSEIQSYGIHRFDIISINYFSGQNQLPVHVLMDYCAPTFISRSLQAQINESSVIIIITTTI